MGYSRISLTLGNTVGIVGTIFALYLLIMTELIQNHFLQFLLYLLSLACLVFFPHCLAHYLVGRVVGIRFRYYFLGRSGVARLHLPLVSKLAAALPVLTLKVNSASLASVSHARRAVMFASGAVASMLLPSVPAIVSLGRLSVTQSVLIFLLVGFNVAFDLYYSPKAGDMARACSSLSA